MLIGCGSFRASRAEKDVNVAGATPHLVRHEIDGKPRFVSLNREGDPYGALALVLASGDMTDASPHLAALLSARLSAHRTRIEVLARLTGVSLIATVNDTRTIANVVGELNAALSMPVSNGELDSLRYRHEVMRFTQSYVNERQKCGNVSNSDAARRDRSTAEMESLRSAVYSSTSASWGLVGERSVLEAAELAIRSLPSWPRKDTVSREGPSGDHVVFSTSSKQDARLRITWRLPTYAMALAAEREIAAPSATLAQSLDAMPSSMHVECVRALPLTSGSELELSIRPQTQATSVTIEELVTAARVAVNELGLFNSSSADELALLATVEQPNSKWAAETAAWLSLSNTNSTSSDRFDVDIQLGSDLSKSSLVLAHQRTLADTLRRAPASNSLPTVRVAEEGQGSVSALIASPCAAWSEPIRSVGATALSIRVLAAKKHDFMGIDLEPWITPEGIGLIGRARRTSPTETSEHLATRLGDTLGRALTAWQLDSSEVWSIRHDALLRLGASPRPALWQAIGTIAGHSPALVLPDGTFASIQGVSQSELSERRLRLLHMPLRLAVIENSRVIPADAEASQGNAVRAALWRWLAPYRNEVEQCPAVADSSSESGESRIDARQLDPDDAAITVAALLPVSDARDEAHAAVLLSVLAGQNGWLVTRLREMNVPGTVDARIVGGSRRRGIVLVVGTTAPSVDAAVRIVRSSIQNLGTGTLDDPVSIERSIRTFVQSNQTRRVDPRARLEDVWLGRDHERRIDARSFGEYLKRAFLPCHLYIVRSESAPARANR
ncbi:MAG TPA: hypothetical protein VIV60_01480 [Polyangiaceae bacterium]